MLKIAIAEQNEKLNDIVKSFPAQILVVPDDLIPDLIRTGRVDMAFMAQSAAAERKYAHRHIEKFSDWMVVVSSNISAENKHLLDALLLRLITTFNAESKYLMRLVSSLGDADNVMKLLTAACLNDVFMVKGSTLARFETVTEYAAYYDIIVQLKEAGARQISLIPIEKYY